MAFIGKLEPSDDCKIARQMCVVMRSHISQCSPMAVKFGAKQKILHAVSCRPNLALVDEGWGGSVAEWLACWTQAQKGPGSNRSHDAVG